MSDAAVSSQAPAPSPDLEQQQEQQGDERAALLRSAADANPGGYGAHQASACKGDALAEDDRLCPGFGQHYPFLDITRIICVWLVAMDHGDHSFGEFNVVFGQNWVLQYLFLVCGVCYGMSKRTLSSYLLRLGGYAVSGICINWSAWLFMRLDWRKDFFNVVFHIWFVIGLMIYAVILAPARRYLAALRETVEAREVRAPQSHLPRPDQPTLQQQPHGLEHQAPEAEHPTSASLVSAQHPASSSALAGEEAQRRGRENEEALDTVAVRLAEWAKSEEREQKDALLNSLVYIGGGILALNLLFSVVLNPLLNLTAPAFLRLVQQFGKNSAFWDLPQNPEESYQFLHRLSTYLMLTCTNFWLLLACPKVFERVGLTAWAVLLNTYGHRLLYYRANDERPFHGIDLMTIALVCYYLGMLHRRKLGEYIVRYWFVVIFVCTLLWPLGLKGRFDENPSKDMQTRMRINLIEFVFVLVWLAAGERLVKREIFTEDRLDFMNDWALVVFLVHKAVHIMLPPPLNFIFLLALIPACYLRRNMP